MNTSGIFYVNLSDDRSFCLSARHYSLQSPVSFFEAQAVWGVVASPEILESMTPATVQLASRAAEVLESCLSAHSVYCPSRFLNVVNNRSEDFIFTLSDGDFQNWTEVEVLSWRGNLIGVTSTRIEDGQVVSHRDILVAEPVQ
ncbi:hypothetical protein [Hasllibacter sp. MH4015]|uniref:hypothetical protein n=1 Tax=Hasllibacter sp. MH4015 TaxID=2854029 RepID=UPI001CD7583F|nr:hypothetical protein [Hasllibacter sp. MH4015]